MLYMISSFGLHIVASLATPIFFATGPVKEHGASAYANL